MSRSEPEVPGRRYHELSEVLTRAAEGVRGPLVGALGRVPGPADRAGTVRVVVEVRDGEGNLLGRGEAPPPAMPVDRPRPLRVTVWCPACENRADLRGDCEACDGTGRAP